MIAIAGFSLLGIALVLSPFLIIAGIRLSKRRRRLRLSDPSDRIAGGWNELVDRATDLGDTAAGRCPTARPGTRKPRSSRRPSTNRAWRRSPPKPIRASSRRDGPDG